MKVIRVTNEIARTLIEAYTQLYCKPNEIKFLQDGNLDWVMSQENLSNKVYLNPNKEALQSFLQANNVLHQFNNILEIIAIYGEEIEYVQPPETDLI